MNKQHFKKFPWASTSILGGISGILLSVIFVVIGAILIKNESISPQSGYYIIIIGQAISVFIVCLLSGRMAGEKSGLSSLITGGIYYLILLAIAILFFDGVSNRLLAGTIATTLGTLGGLYFVVRGKVLNKKKKHTHRFR